MQLPFTHSQKISGVLRQNLTQVPLQTMASRAVPPPLISRRDVRGTGWNFIFITGKFLLLMIDWKNAMAWLLPNRLSA
ncbi:hypothetical protein CK934_14295 [Chitinophaga sp. MD30]|nr:hypothetical protein CK934_14295 [Chitinophaga sp. MD30]